MKGNKTGLDLDITRALDFYKRFMIGSASGKAKIFKKYGFTIEGTIGSKDWEVFAAILLKDKHKPGGGADLFRHEVKSATGKGGFEYQYHKNSGLRKLQGDRAVDHVFVVHNKDYTDVAVWWLSREHVLPKLDKWLPKLKKNYRSKERQRFRVSFGQKFVTDHGKLILSIKGTRRVLPNATGAK